MSVLMGMKDKLSNRREPSTRKGAEKDNAETQDAEETRKKNRKRSTQSSHRARRHREDTARQKACVQGKLQRYRIWGDAAKGKGAEEKKRAQVLSQPK